MTSSRWLIAMVISSLSRVVLLCFYGTSVQPANINQKTIVKVSAKARFTKLTRGGI